jgi:hypothetical protein
MQAYDQHLNMILGDVEEVVTTVEIDDETYEEIVRVSSFAFLPLVFIMFSKSICQKLLDAKLSFSLFFRL